MAAQPFRCASAAALAFDSAKHICKIARVVSGVGHDPRTENVRLGFIIAAVAQKITRGEYLSGLCTRLAAEDRTAEYRSDAEDLIQRIADLGLLCRCVTQRHVAYLVSHHAGHLSFVLCGLDHPAVYIHRSAG